MSNSKFSDDEMLSLRKFLEEVGCLDTLIEDRDCFWLFNFGSANVSIYCIDPRIHIHVRCENPAFYELTKLPTVSSAAGSGYMFSLSHLRGIDDLGLMLRNLVTIVSKMGSLNT